MNNVLFTTALLASLSAAVACGGNEAPPTTPTSSEHGGHGGGHGDHHGGNKGEHKGEHGDHHKDLPPTTKAFHDVLAPLWHMEKGPDRTAKTCAQIATLRDKATATGNKELVAATTALSAECDKEGRPEFDARFTTVHERFHALAE
jgi:hypothetical protein